MTKRRLSVTILAWVFVAAGSIGVVAGTTQIFSGIGAGGLSALNRHELTENGLIVVSGLIAALGGAGLLRDFRWARWVCLTWMALHVLLSILHSPIEVAIHVVMLAVMIYILFWPHRPEIIQG